jgi:hypothetical protein
MKPQTLILIMMVVTILVAPAMAIQITAEPLNVESTTTHKTTSLTYDGSSLGLGIQRIGIDTPTGGHVDFTITYGNGDTVVGSVDYSNDGFFQQNSQIVLGGETSDYHYVGLEEIGRFYVGGYAINETPAPPVSGLVMYGSSFGLSTITSDFVFYPTTLGSDGVMYKIELASNLPVDVVIMTNPRGEVAVAKSKGLLEVINDWVLLAIKFAGTLYDLAVQTFYWLKFFFWDNLILTLALYIALTGAIAFNQSKNVFAAIKKFFQYQRGIFNFIISMWEALINLISSFRGIFRL